MQTHVHADGSMLPFGPHTGLVMFSGIWPFTKKAALPNFDLHSVEQNLKTNHQLYDGVPLTEQELARGLREYREFLSRHKAAGMPVPFEKPSFLVDRVWHAHMVETEQYARDCKAYFGQMFHHRGEMCSSGGE